MYLPRHFPSSLSFLSVSLYLCLCLSLPLEVASRIFHYGSIFWNTPLAYSDVHWGPWTVLYNYRWLWGFVHTAHIKLMARNNCRGGMLERALFLHFYQSVDWLVLFFWSLCYTKKANPWNLSAFGFYKVLRLFNHIFEV